MRPTCFAERHSNLVRLLAHSANSPSLARRAGSSEWPLSRGGFDPRRGGRFGSLAPRTRPTGYHRGRCPAAPGRRSTFPACPTPALPSTGRSSAARDAFSTTSGRRPARSSSRSCGARGRTPASGPSTRAGRAARPAWRRWSPERTSRARSPPSGRRWQPAAPRSSGRPTGTRWPRRRSATRGRSWPWSPREAGTSPRTRPPSSRSTTSRSRWSRTRARRPAGTRPACTSTRRTTCSSAPSGHPGKGSGSGSSGPRSGSVSPAATPRVSGMPMEGSGAVAAYDRANGTLEFHSSTQVPHILRDGLARSLRIAAGRIRVVAPDVGGGFGPKMQLLPEEVAAAALAVRLGRPVKWVQDRMEHLQSAFHSRDAIIEAEAAAECDGRLVGLRATARSDVGAYSSFPLGCSLDPQTAGGGAPRAVPPAVLPLCGGRGRHQPLSHRGVPRGRVPSRDARDRKAHEPDRPRRGSRPGGSQATELPSSGGASAREPRRGGVRQRRLSGAPRERTRSRALCRMAGGAAAPRRRGGLARPAPARDRGVLRR